MPDDPDMIQFRPAPEATTWDARRAELARDVERVSDRLRGLSAARLSAAAPPHSSRAAAARATAQTLADASAGLEACGARAAPPWRTLPELGDFAVGDQVAVAGHDLVAATQQVAPGTPVWARHGRPSAHEVLGEAADALVELRRLL